MKHTHTLFFAFVFVCQHCLVNGQENPTVVIEQGELLGNFGVTRDGRQYKEFLAVPYGQIPRRFDEGRLAGGWSGVRNATASSDGCMTLNFALPDAPVVGREDCLDLDISTPYLPGDAAFPGAMPVLLYVAGGGFMAGASGMYKSKYFMDEDVVFVGVNSRFMAFGYLSADIDGARGNQGMKDIVLSLRWVQNNIAAFGGDPSRVTVFGHSAMGAIVSFLTLSPSLTEGLMSGAIMQSGVALGQAFLRQVPGIKYSKMLATLFDCPISNATKMMDCLREVPAEDIAKLFLLLPSDEFSWRRDANHGIHFSPTIELYADGPSDPFVLMDEPPKSRLERGDFLKIPMMLGKTSCEFCSLTEYIVTDRNWTDAFNREFGRRLPEYMLYDESAPDPCIVTGAIKNFYFNGEDVGVNNVDQFSKLIDDRFVHVNAKMISEYSKLTNVYSYNFTKYRDGSTHQPGHQEELEYLFYLEGFAPEITPGHPDYAFSKELVSTWASFARDGKPQAFSNGEVWNPNVPGELHTWMQLNEQPANKVVDDEYLRTVEFWNSLKLPGLNEP